MLNNVYFYYSRARLNSFVGGKDWLIVFQVIAYFTRSAELGNFLYAYGSVIPDGIDQDKYLVYATQLDKKDIADRFNFKLSIRGKSVKAKLTEDDYAEYDIPVDEEHPPELDVARIVGWKYADLVFLPEDELLDFLGLSGRRLRPFLTLEDWYHPNVADDELPSQSDSLDQLAEAMSKKDKSAYKLQGTGNTHWSNWEQDSD
jgi:hypothetical protein